MRLDTFLTENKIYESRTRSARAIKENCVKVNGKTITKASFEVNEDDKIEWKADPVPYVSRGAFKLEFGLDKANIDVEGLKAVDIGASTGGFTEVLLMRNIESVAAVDIGHDQLNDKIKNNPKVASFEGTDIRDFIVDEGKYDIAVTDVSFISIKIIAPHIFRLLKNGGRAVILIKPQFEVGKKFLNKKGVVKDVMLAHKTAKEIADFFESIGLKVAGLWESPIKGGDGNTEFVCVCRRENEIDV